MQSEMEQQIPVSITKANFDGEALNIAANWSYDIVDVSKQPNRLMNRKPSFFPLSFVEIQYQKCDLHRRVNEQLSCRFLTY